MGDPVQSSTRRIVARAAMLLIPVVALAAAAPWVVERFRPGRGNADMAERPDRPPTDEELRASRKADERLADVVMSARHASAIAPADAEVDASGERVRWFPGFGVAVESQPRGATVLVNGQDLGETPLTASVECAPGELVQVEVRKARHRPERRTTHCRKDQLVELSVELR
jgi:hypothetical protein